MERVAMIAEVMRRIDTRIGVNDPICAVIEMNRIALEEAVGLLLERAAPLANGIRDAGRELAAQVARSTVKAIASDLAGARSEIAREAQAAKEAAAVAIRQVAESHRGEGANRWLLFGILVCCLFSCLSYAAGYASASPPRVCLPQVQR